MRSYLPFCLHGGDAARRHGNCERELLKEFPFLMIWEFRLLQQYAGRLNRACEGKRKIRIYDYVEIDDRRLGRMWRNVKKAIKQWGIRF